MESTRPVVSTLALDMEFDAFGVCSCKNMHELSHFWWQKLSRCNEQADSSLRKRREARQEAHCQPSQMVWSSLSKLVLWTSWRMQFQHRKLRDGKRLAQHAHSETSSRRQTTTCPMLGRALTVPQARKQHHRHLKQQQAFVLQRNIEEIWKSSVSLYSGFSKSWQDFYFSPSDATASV